MPFDLTSLRNLKLHVLFQRNNFDRILGARHATTTTTLLTERRQVRFRRRLIYISMIYIHIVAMLRQCAPQRLRRKLWKTSQSQKEAQVFKRGFFMSCCPWLTGLCVSVCQSSDEISGAQDQVICMSQSVSAVAAAERGQPWLSVSLVVDGCGGVLQWERTVLGLMAVTDDARASFSPPFCPSCLLAISR